MSPTMALSFNRLAPAHPLAVHFKNTIQGTRYPVFQGEHFLVHSQLLKESHLVHFPPPTYMLKFSRYIRFISSYAHTQSNSKSNIKPMMFIAFAEHIKVVMRIGTHMPKDKYEHTHTAIPGQPDISIAKSLALNQAYPQAYPKGAHGVRTPFGSRNSAIHNEYCIFATFFIIKRAKTFIAKHTFQFYNSHAAAAALTNIFIHSSIVACTKQTMPPTNGQHR